MACLFIEAIPLHLWQPTTALACHDLMQRNLDNYIRQPRLTRGNGHCIVTQRVRAMNPNQALHACYTAHRLYCISKLQTFVFKKCDDFVKSWTFYINELHEFNNEVCQDLMNDYSNKRELLDALEKKVKHLSQQLLMMMMLLICF